MWLSVAKEMYTSKLTGLSQNSVYNLEIIFNSIRRLYYNFLVHYYFITTSQLLLSSSSQYFSLHSLSQLMTLLHIAKCKAIRWDLQPIPAMTPTEPILASTAPLLPQMNFLCSGIMHTISAWTYSRTLFQQFFFHIFRILSVWSLPSAWILFLFVALKKNLRPFFCQLLAPHYFAPLYSKTPQKCFF